MKFCASELCRYNIDISPTIIRHGAMDIEESGLRRKIRRYPFCVSDGPNKTKVIWFCEVCKNAIDMTVA